MNTLTIWNDLLHLFFPKICTICKTPLVQMENQICLQCIYKLPRTGYHLYQDNPATQLFHGKVNIEAAYTFLFFQKGNMVQQLIHSLKYYDNKELGYILGKTAALEIFSSSANFSFDLIIPVPLHPKRKKERGYNQSELIARGISHVLDVPVNTNILIRHLKTTPQVSKSLYERWRNTESHFSIKENISDVHILLVDDVMTSGSTMNACAETLLSNKGIKVSLFTLAIA